MITNAISKLKLEKIKDQRSRIKAAIMQGHGAEIEMPNHEVLFPENIEWLKEKGITVNKVRDRDGKPIVYIDIGGIDLEMPKDYKTALDKEKLIDNSLRYSRRNTPEKHDRKIYQKS